MAPARRCVVYCRSDDARDAMCDRGWIDHHRESACRLYRYTATQCTSRTELRSRSQGSHATLFKMCEKCEIGGKRERSEGSDHGTFLQHSRRSVRCDSLLPSKSPPSSATEQESDWLTMDSCVKKRRRCNSKQSIKHSRKWIRERMRQWSLRKPVPIWIRSCRR